MKKVILLLIVLIGGCAAKVWVDAGGHYQNEDLGFSAELPQGWMRVRSAPYLLSTRDGLALQNIAIERLDVREPLKNTKKRLQPGMTPMEAAEVALDSLALRPGVNDLEIAEIAPATIDGLDGFRAVCVYKDQSGIKYKTVYCGVISGPWFYAVRYTAAERQYFQKDLDTFESVLSGFRLTEKSSND